MHIAMKFIILVIVLTTIFIVYNLLKTRNTIKKQAEIELQKKEGFDTMEKMKQSDYPISIQPLQDKYSNLHLREFVIKSSYNSAHFNETDTDVEAISVVLKRGCRLLDFEVKVDNDNIMKVGTTTLSTIFSKVASEAFTTTSLSPFSPLFLYLHTTINSPVDADKLNDLLIRNFPNKLYRNTTNKPIQVDGSTILRDIVGRVIVITDGLKYNNIANIRVDIAGEITKYTDDTLPVSDKILLKDDGISTTINTLSMVVPDTNQTNIDSNSVFDNGYPQIILYKFYEGGSKNLDNYEDIFNDAQSSLVPISYLIRKSTVDTDAIKKQESKIKSAVPSKPAAPLGNGWFK